MKKREPQHKSDDRRVETVRMSTPRRLRPVEGIDYIGVGVGAMVFDASFRVFLAKRGPAARNERQHWEFPGGAVQLHERMSDAIKREFLEEFGMRIKPEGLLCIMDHILPSEHQHWVSACFIARHVSGRPQIREREKCLEVIWAQPSELPGPLTHISSNFLRAYNNAVRVGTGRGSRQMVLPRQSRLLGYVSDAERGR